jgi:hypothetical protein
MNMRQISSGKKIALGFASALLLASNVFALPPAPTDIQAQQAHAQGACGSLGPGTGLGVDGRGWVVSMLPGKHEFRMVGGGTVGVTVLKQPTADFDAGRPYYIVVSGAPADGHLEWKVPGRDWGPISKLFLYPPSGNIYKR